MSVYRSRVDATSEPPEREEGDPEGAAIAWVFLLVGMIPVVGIMVRGSWDGTELSVGMLMAAPAAYNLVVRYAARLAQRRSRARAKEQGPRGVLRA